MQYRFPLLIVLLLLSCTVFGQKTQNESAVFVRNEDSIALSNVTILLLQKDSVLYKSSITDSYGRAAFTDAPPGLYILKASHTGFQPFFKEVSIPNFSPVHITLIRSQTSLQGVTVIAKKPFASFLPDKTVINVEAAITNAGATVMEVLERSPGITIDRDGNISMKGKPSVLVMIDGKISQLSTADLQHLLSGMNASEVESIELIDNPGAKYDAAGNAGIINIKLKKNRQKGLNGNISTSLGHGILPKNNNSFLINYRNGSWNFFGAYNTNFNRQLLDLYALRTYYDGSGNISSLLQQPYNTRTKNNIHSLRSGVDYFLSGKTTIGAVYSGTYLNRNNSTQSRIEWQQATREVDSVITTAGKTGADLEQRGINFNGRHQFNKASELTADVDFIRYSIFNDQYFENQVLASGSVAEASRGRIPSMLRIFSAKADYAYRANNFVWEAGWKSARIATDNRADYFYLDDGEWKDDLGKSNHFLYNENIHAVYSSIDRKSGKWHWQTGLRYEYTAYDARQLGNAIVKDSSFDRRYSNLFPTAFLTYETDSSNSFTIRMGRRIDRPAFHKLNPFVFIINKYTFQKGNPFFKPQFTWNLELNHVYKGILSTSVSYNLTKDYISQIFYANTDDGTVTYSDGNIGELKNIGIASSLQLSPKKWWSFTTQAVYNHKIIEGVLWKQFKRSINQLSLNLNNQFRLQKGWGAELSGFFISRNQNDIQEVLESTGQVGLGISKQVFKGQGSLKLTARDIFYTQDMEGFTLFEGSDEYFRMQWDSRVVALSFNYRFGKAFKLPKRSGGGATDEINRVSTGN